MKNKTKKDKEPKTDKGFLSQFQRELKKDSKPKTPTGYEGKR